MSESLGDAVLHLRTDDSQFDAGIDAAEGKVKGAADRISATGTRMVEAGKRLSIGMSAPLVAFGFAAGKAASDAEELQSAFDQTFGALSGEMNQWAEATGDAMGRSTQEMQRAANMFGLFFNQAAPTKQAAADMSKEFAQLGQDLASFHNVDPGEAMENLRAGLSGEAEPLRKFGVFLNEGAVAAKALEMGLASSSKELTDQDKILARYQLILEATKNAQGDVARTSGSTANQVRAANAAWEEAQVAIGTKLLPAITPLITGLADLLNWFAQLPAPVQTTVLGFMALGAALGPAMIGFGGLLKGVGAVLPMLSKLGPVFTLMSGGILKVIPIIANLGRALMVLALNPVFLTIAALVAGIYLAWQNWDKIAPIIDGVGKAISNWWTANVQPILTAAGDKVKELVAIFTEHFGNQLKNVVAMVTALMNGDFRGAWEAMKRFVGTAIEGAFKLVEAFAPNVARTLRALASNMIAMGRDMIAGLAQGIRNAASAVWEALKSVVMAGINRIRDFLGIRSPSLLFQEMGKYITDGLALGIDDGISTVEAAMDRLGEAVQDKGNWTVDPDGVPMSLPEGGSGNDPSPTAPPPETEEQWRQGFRSWFKDGIRAALDGDLGGFLKNWLGRMADGMFDRALDQLADVAADLIGSIFGGSSGGGGEGIVALFSSLFGGGFATGGKAPMGKWSIVGERGPEPIFPTMSGTLVRPNSSLGSFARGLQPAGHAVTIHMPIDATGADPAALARVVSAMERFQAEMPAMMLGTIQEAGERGMLATGKWR